MKIKNNMKTKSRFNHINQIKQNKLTKTINRNHIKKFLLGFSFTAIFCSSLWFAGLYWLSAEIKEKQSEIQERIHQQIGLPFQYDTLETQTHLQGISITLNNLIINDASKIPLLTINKLELHPDLIRSLLKRKLILQNINAIGLKMHYKWDEKKRSVTLLGLAGEEITLTSTPSKPWNLKSILSGLSSQKRISLEDAEIEWTGNFGQIHQQVSGQFDWISPESHSFQFRGKQSLQINEGSFFKPAPLEFSFDPSTAHTYFKTGLANVALELNFAPEKGLMCDIKADHLDLAALNQNNLIIKGPKPTWINWFTQATTSGYADGHMKVFGPLDNLDWKGEFRFRKLNMKYAALWPAIEHAKGTVNIEKNTITVDVDGGELLETAVDTGRIVIAPIATGVPAFVSMEGTFSGHLENAMTFLEQCPLQKVHQRLAAIQPKGQMALALNLKIPLKKKDQTDQTSKTDKTAAEVQGSVRVKDAQLSISDNKLPIEKVNGTFDFTAKGVTTKEAVHAEFLKRPVTIRANGEEGITATTFLTTEYLAKLFPNPLLDHFKGEADVALTIPNEEATWTLSSDLKGVVIDLPEPLGKPKEEIRPMNLTVKKLKNETKNETQYSLHAQDLIDAKWKMITDKTIVDKTITNNSMTDTTVIDKTVPDQEKSTLTRGHIVFGQGLSDWPKEDSLLISGYLAELDLNQWKSFFQAQSKKELDIPIIINLSSEKLLGFDMQFLKTKIYHDSRKPNDWYLEGPMLTGNITLPSTQDNTLQLDLEQLNIAGDTDKQHATRKFLNNEAKNPISFACKSVIMGGKNLGNINFKLTPSSSGFTIQSLTAASNAYQVEAFGEWNLKNSGSASTILKGQLTSNNVGAALKQMGFSSAVREGAGRVRFDLNWADNPFDFSLNKVQGSAAVHIKSGRIKGVDAGLGRLLGLLNIESIQRRLQLDFSDVFQKGFAFDTIQGSMNFQQGIATTERFGVEGPSAKIDLTGSVNLETKGLNLRMYVTPKLMSSSLPIAAGLATGNPAVGVGVWVFDKLTNSKLSNIAQHQYQVIGTWESPNIVEGGSSLLRGSQR